MAEIARTINRTPDRLISAAATTLIITVHAIQPTATTTANPVDEGGAEEGAEPIPVTTAEATEDPIRATTGTASRENGIPSHLDTRDIEKNGL